MCVSLCMYARMYDGCERSDVSRRAEYCIKKTSVTVSPMRISQLSTSMRLRCNATFLVYVRVCVQHPIAKRMAHLRHVHNTHTLTHARTCTTIPSSVTCSARCQCRSTLIIALTSHALGDVRRRQTFDNVIPMCVGRWHELSRTCGSG